jgi:mRNA-degrading endonuclease RelE of RelBE toxin-antitoxin system
VKKFRFEPNVAAEIRAISQQTAMQILTALHRYVEIGKGDVKSLSGEYHGKLRLRVGDHRVIFSETADTITIHRVHHRRDAYR